MCAANYRYKVEGVVDADPETVFSYIDPTPASPRAKWDKAIRELQVIEQLDKAIYNNVLLYTCIQQLASSVHYPPVSLFLLTRVNVKVVENLKSCRLTIA